LDQNVKQELPNKPAKGGPPKEYQPSIGTKLLMMGLCIVGLIIIWTYYFHAAKP